MLCPVCKVDMFVLEFEQVEIDFCYTCGGVWLDSGELEMIGERAGAVRQDLLERGPGAEGRHTPLSGVPPATPGSPDGVGSPRGRGPLLPRTRAVV